MVSENTDDALRKAIPHLQAGRLDEAERICREVLAASPHSAAAWHMLGTIALDMGRPEIAAQMIERAIQYGLQNASILSHLGQCYLRLNRVDDARSIFHQALQLDPNCGEAIYGLGTLLAAEGKFAEAVPLLSRAAAMFSGVIDLHHNYAYCLSRLGRIPEAVRQWQMAIALDPNHAPTLLKLGATLAQSKNYDQALPLLARLIEIQPRFVDGYIAYGEALAGAGKFDEAISVIRRAAEIEPRRAELFDMLGIFCSYAGRMDESLEASKHAVELKPDFFNAILNTGVTLRRLERFDDAIEYFERAAQLKPDELTVSQALFSCHTMNKQYEKALEAAQRAFQYHPQHPHIHFDHATALLALGRYIEGFEEYEWRWRCKGFDASIRHIEGPQWDAVSDTSDKTIFLHCEQGYGDIIQFARYIPMLQPKCKQVLVGVPWDIRAVLVSSFNVKVVDNLDRSVMPSYDLHFPLMSLARAFKTTFDAVPNAPYLRTDPARVEKWKSKIDSHARGLKVGIVWGGSPSPEPRRSCSIQALSALADVPGVSWYSLQTDEHRQQLREAPPGMNILDIGRDFHDFADSAAVMSQLDLLITIDTASAHLAGALGVKTWAMIIYSPDWRWGLEGDSTPWYPSLRIFRQPKLDDWPSVVRQMRGELMFMAGKQ